MQYSQWYYIVGREEADNSISGIIRVMSSGAGNITTCITTKT